MFQQKTNNIKRSNWEVQLKSQTTIWHTSYLTFWQKPIEVTPVFQGLVIVALLLEVGQWGVRNRRNMWRSARKTWECHWGKMWGNAWVSCAGLSWLEARSKCSKTSFNQRRVYIKDKKMIWICGRDLNLCLNPKIDSSNCKTDAKSISASRPLNVYTIFRVNNCEIGLSTMSGHGPIYMSVELNDNKKSTLWRLNTNILNNPVIKNI